MSMQEVIESKLADGIRVVGLEVINESYMHNVPPGSESHFKVIIISDEFSDQRHIQRHQKINHILREELSGGIHALSIQTLTPEEWKERGGAAFPSPECLGGSKKD